MNTDLTSQTRTQSLPKTQDSKPALSPRQRFLAACAAQPLDHPPIWLMRQAGRALPEYRALKEKYSFLELVRTPELAAQVTLQPIQRFDFDAAVLFSDILVIAEALGQPYRFRNGGGIEMDFPIRTSSDIDRLNTSNLRERLDYVSQALTLLRTHLGSNTALLGFAGSPWTLANFMMQGGSAAEFTAAKNLFYTDPTRFNRLLEKLTDAVVDHLSLQIDAGADAVQIFDTLGDLLAADAYHAASSSWIQKTIQRLNNRVPVILFVRGRHSPWSNLTDTGAQILGVDWRVSLAAVRKQLPPHLAVQGNLDPFLMTTEPHIVAHATRQLLDSMRGLHGHIFNLGHGLPPGAKLENIQALVHTVREFK